MLLIRTYANQGELTLALEWSNCALLADKLYPKLHYLQAELFFAQGNILQSIASIKRTLFIDPNFILAHLMLGILEKQQGNTKSALRSFKIALELIDHHLPNDPLPDTEEMTSEYFKDIITTNLNKLDQCNLKI